MYYAMISENIENSQALRKTARAAHIARREALRTEGRLLTAGPQHPAVDTTDPDDAGFNDSLVIAGFDNPGTTQIRIDNNPCIETSICTRVTVKPFQAVLPADAAPNHCSHSHNTSYYYRRAVFIA